MAKIWLGILMILGIDLLLIGLVSGIIFVVCTGWVELSRRRQARRFAEAVALRNFEQAETRAKRAFLTDGLGEQAWTRSIAARQ
jgi:type II secretory pathway pseudopilin PulG